MEFLNKLSKDKVARLSIPFKNEGRGLVKQDKAQKDKGKWDPAVGSYHPKFETI